MFFILFTKFFGRILYEVLHKEIGMNLFSEVWIFSFGIKDRKDELVAPPILSFFLVQFNIPFKYSFMISHAALQKFMVKSSGPGALSTFRDQIAFLISYSKMSFANSLFSYLLMSFGITERRSNCASGLASSLFVQSSRKWLKACDFISSCPAIFFPSMSFNSLMMLNLCLTFACL